MAAFVDITGERYARLLVLERAPNVGRYVSWKCRCDCGRTVIVGSNRLRQGNTRSCGCLKIDELIARRKIENPEIEFWKRVVKHPGPYACWEWQDSTNNSGYGSFQGKGAHVFSYELEHGPLPPDRPWALHKCDNRVCVRPDHLFPGTRSDNFKDALNKGRTHFQKHPEQRPRGESHANAKLTSRAVSDIRRLYATGKYRQTDLARMFGSTQAGVSQIIRNASWRTSGGAR